MIGDYMQWINILSKMLDRPFCSMRSIEIGVDPVGGEGVPNV